MSHECPAPDCSVQAPYDQLACRAHWYQLPKALRDEVWRAYRVQGQGSEEHDEAIEACIDFLERQAA